MCGGTESKRESYEMRPRRVELVQTITRLVQPLSMLGYDIGYNGLCPNPSLRNGAQDYIDYHTIRLAGHPQSEMTNVATLAASVGEGLLVVSQVHLTRDRRPKGEKPLSADIYLAYWVYELGQPIISLRTLYFEEVEEPGMIDTRREAYGMMRKSFGHHLTMRRGGSKFGEAVVFKDIYDKTKFGRSARTIVQEFQEMRDAGIRVKSFTFLPQRVEGFRYGDVFNFVVTFE
ncbi:hypothetical protein Daus18300_011408 [Diaporthe australafricana]|uniref:Uncharacterized protein n=1 Tax=Diaporthe australafricana TaxID=127596 RepID=A0ABR3W6L9_9PEZI